MDDEVPLTQITEDMLTLLGFEPTCLSDPREAMALIREDPSQFDIILTDQTMPRMFGSDLAKEVAALKNAPPVAICTGLTQDPKILGLPSEVICGVLAKPISMDDLSSFILGTVKRQE